MPLVRRKPEAILKRRARPVTARTERQVARIIKSVRQQGDKALFYWTQTLDGVRLDKMAADMADAQKALDALDPHFRQALELAVTRVRAFHEAVRPASVVGMPPTQGIEARLYREPIRRVAVYVPAGRWPLPSSVIMGVVPAQVAGVREIAIFTPPRQLGAADGSTLAIAALLGVASLYTVGGAQAVAAAAYGTESIQRVDKLVGPGNRWVTEAKRQVQGAIGIDGLNGPSEVVIWADAPDVDPGQIARDLLAQAEHDPESWAILVTTSEDVLDRVRQEIARLAVAWNRESLLAQAGVGAVLVREPDEALDFIEQFCPEHLELWGAAAEFGGQVRSAGATFINCPTPLGDYVAGPNHVLPTGGSARFASVLGVDDFLRRRTEIRVVGRAARPVVRAGATLAEVEGLAMHQRALEAFEERVNR